MESKSDAAMNQSNVTRNLTSMSSIYFKVFSFEEKFSPEKARGWMLENWTSAFYFCTAYVFLVFSIKWGMRNRPSFKLRKGLIAWNAMLATFSTMGAIRALSEFYYVMSNYDLYHSVCYPSVAEPDKVFGFWSWAFALSKLVEFGDTMFIVLRKQELKFLHWYHHITVLLYTWPAYAHHTSTTRWFMTMNYSVHSIMYTYYMLRALGFSLPRSFMIFITTLQILQMVFGCLSNYWAYMYSLAGRYCDVSGTMMMFSFLMYLSYLILFSHFFYIAYLSPDRRKRPSSIRDNKVKSQ